jgi:hypothetical protein
MMIKPKNQDPRTKKIRNNIEMLLVKYFNLGFIWFL